MDDALAGLGYNEGESWRQRNEEILAAIATLPDEALLTLAKEALIKYERDKGETMPLYHNIIDWRSKIVGTCDDADDPADSEEAIRSTCQSLIASVISTIDETRFGHSDL